MNNTHTITGEVEYKPDGIRGTKMTIAFDDAQQVRRSIALPLCQEQIAYARIQPRQDVTVTFHRPVEHIGDRAREEDLAHIQILAAER